MSAGDPMREIDLLLLETIMRPPTAPVTTPACASPVRALGLVCVLVCCAVMLISSRARGPQMAPKVADAPLAEGSDPSFNTTGRLVGAP